MVSKTRKTTYQKTPTSTTQQKTKQKKTKNTAETSIVTTRERSSSTDKLTELYENLRSVPSYSAKVADFLRYHDVHSKHRRIVKKVFPRRRIITRFPFEIFQADIAVYNKSKYVHANGNYAYILVVIDCFTKRLWAIPLKFNNKEWVADAFQSIFDSLPEIPIHIITDRGAG